jgi:hypothetical protein
MEYFQRTQIFQNPRHALDLALMGLPKAHTVYARLFLSRLHLFISHVYLHLNHEETHSSGNPTPNRVYTLVLQVAG